MKHIAIVNTQALGDCLLGTHTARLYKKRYPSSNITFLVRHNLTATTSENSQNTAELLNILEMQYGVDNIGVITPDGNIQTKRAISKQFDKIIVQDKWFSDLGIVRSQSVEIKEDGFDDTETEFNVGTEKKLPNDRLVITTAGPLDWNRKLHSEKTRQQTLFGIITYLKQNSIPAEIIPLGKDVDNFTILEAMRQINNSHIFIGPLGLFVHAAAGLGVDTIHATSVFPEHYDSPKYYHSGWHRPIKGKIHCQTYACVSEKLSSTQVYPEGPQAKFGFWPKTCEFTENKMSCVNNISSTQMVEAFIEWYTERGRTCVSR